MKRELVDEIIECLGNDRRVFYYYKDRYCIDKIKYDMKMSGVDEATICSLKKSNNSKYLTKPILKSLAKKLGDGIISQNHLDCAWAEVEVIPFTLSFTHWGGGDRGWDQTTRNQSNLVLQLNFDNQHDKKYLKLVKPEYDDGVGPFESYCHPINRKGKNTLAWVRMDVDFDSDEVLIEEVQMDWLRNVERSLKRIDRRRARVKDAKPSDVCCSIHGGYQDLQTYSINILERYRKIWAEAALTAAIEFIRYELGISRIFYHTYETGRKVKGIYGSPPKSIYTSLPRKLGFEVVDEIPNLLMNNNLAKRYLKKIKNPQWQILR